MKQNQNLFSSLFKKIFITKYFLLFIFLISFALRAYKIDHYPLSLNWDEVSLGYNSFSIINTGKDEWGKSFPTIFRAYGDYKLPIYIYLSTVPVFLLGLNPFSTRFISILSGSITPIFIYLIFKKIFKKNLIAFTGALIYSLSPWTIFLSRVALEANLFLTLFIASIYFLKNKKLSLSLILYSLSLFTYNSSRVLFPFYLLLVYYIYKTYKVNLYKHKISILIFIFSLLLFFYQSLDTSGQARYKWVSIIDEGAVNQINQLRQVYPRIIANKATYFVIKSLGNYLSHFNPAFLFARGGSHYQFNIPGFYLISPFLSPFLIFGLYKFFKNKKYIPILLLLICPIPSAITRDAPHTLRSIVFISTACFISIYGLMEFFKNRTKTFFLYSLGLLILTQIQFWPKYKHYSAKYVSSWQYGYSQMVDFLKENYNNYQNFYITKKYGEPHEFVLFYWPWLPSDYQGDPNKIWDYHDNWYWVDGFDKFVFIDDWKIKNISTPQNSIFITSPGNFSNQGKIIKTIDDPNNQTIFEIVSYE